MEDSVTYQAIIRKGFLQGFLQGFQQGFQQGALQEAKETLLRLGPKRFGEPQAATVAAVEAIDDLGRLKRLRSSLLDAASWEDLLATP